MARRLLYLFITVLGTFIFFPSCMSKKKLYRLRDDYQILRTGIDSLGIVGTWKERQIREGDKLSISIKTESLNSDQLTVFDNGREYDYLVNANGFVLMPFVGSIKIKGLTRMQALDTIKSKMAKHIKDPFISIRALDVHVKVLGQVEKQGPLIMPENDATIVNALAQSGGINEFARRDSILIIREEDGIRKHIVVDMRDGQKLFSSEGYRLKHNDLLVISSNKTFYKSLRNNETNIGLGALTPITAVLGILFFTVPLISYLRR